MTLDIATSISKKQGKNHTIRGHKVVNLIKDKTLVDMLFLLWRGDLPTPKEKKLLDAMLVSVVEHGVEAPSIFISRVVASTGNTMNAALASSALSVGEKHGGAIESAARMLLDEKSAQEIVEERLTQKRTIPGLGHKVYKTEDPRTTAIHAKAEQLKFKNTYFKKAYDIETEFKKQKGKKLPLNVDGALAACMLELGFDPMYGKALFIIPRMIGASAHVVEELSGSTSYRRLA